MNETEAYIEVQSTEVQKILNEIRRLIKETVPDAEEVFAYQMPAFKTHGKPLVYFAAFKNHIGFYATPTGHEAFKAELAVYKQGKGSVQFPLSKPIPYSLIKRIVQFRADENESANVKHKVKKSKKVCVNGHTYFKSSDCPVCPVCQNNSKPRHDFLSKLSAPARRALENEGIDSLAILANFSEQEILKLHGMGKSSIPKLKDELATIGLCFKPE